jgi:hypothetical protein
MVIDGYSMGGYWCLIISIIFVIIILMAINGYSIGGYR